MFRYVSYSIIIFQKKTFWGINEVVAQFACTVCGILQYLGVTESDVLLKRLKFNSANWEIWQQAIKIIRPKNFCTKRHNPIEMFWIYTRILLSHIPHCKLLLFKIFLAAPERVFFFYVCMYGCVCSICCIPLPDCRFSLIHYRQCAEACELYRRSNPPLQFRRYTAKQPPLQGYSNEFIISATLSSHKTGFLLVRFKCSFVICCHAQNDISVMIFFLTKKCQSITQRRGCKTIHPSAPQRKKGVQLL